MTAPDTGCPRPVRDRITVTGRARRRVTPDIATWSAAVEARGTEQREAFAACSKKLAVLLTAVTNDAGDGAEVSAGGVYVSPEWDDRGRKRVGFVASATVQIRGTLEEAGRLGQVALDKGAIRLDGPGFEVDGLATIRDELLSEAVAAARRTANGMAAADQRTVGRALRISDTSEPTYIGWAPQPKYARSAAMEMQADAPPLEPGAQEVEASALVVFELVE